MKKNEGELPEPIYALEAIGEDIESEISESDSAKIKKQSNDENSEKEENSQE